MELNFCESVLGDLTSVLYVKGQLKNIQRKVKESGEIYYIADLKVFKRYSNDCYSNDCSYGITFDNYNICFATDFVIKNNINDNKMKELKNNEVVCKIIPSCSVKKVNDAKFNRVNFYVIDILQSQILVKSDVANI